MNLTIKRRQYFGAAILMYLFSVPLFADVDMLFETQVREISEIQTTPESQTTSGEVHGLLHLTVGKNYFQIGENGLEFIYDFSGRKVYILDPKSKIFEVYSL